MRSRIRCTRSPTVRGGAAAEVEEALVGVCHPGALGSAGMVRPPLTPPEDDDDEEEEEEEEEEDAPGVIHEGVFTTCIPAGLGDGPAGGSPASLPALLR